MPEMPGYYLWFGDGTLTVVKKTEDGFDEDKGIRVKRVWMRMDEKYERRNGVKEFDKEPATGFVMREYNADYLVPLDDNPDTQTWMAICDFEGTLNNKFVDIIDAANLRLVTALRKRVYQLEIHAATLQMQKTRLSEDRLADIKELAKVMSNLKQGVQSNEEMGSE